MITFKLRSKTIRRALKERNKHINEDDEDSKPTHTKLVFLRFQSWEDTEWDRKGNMSVRMTKTLRKWAKNATEQSKTSRLPTTAAAYLCACSPYWGLWNETSWNWTASSTAAAASSMRRMRSGSVDCKRASWSMRAAASASSRSFSSSSSSIDRKE